MVIGEQTMADAILDHIVRDAHRIELPGESLRKSLKNKITEDVETFEKNLILYIIRSLEENGRFCWSQIRKVLRVFQLGIKDM